MFKSLTRMTKGGNIAERTVTPVDDSVDAATVARWLNCSTRQVREYTEQGLVIRTGPGRFDLEASVRGVIKHLRELASGHRSEGADVVKASAELKQSQKRLVDLRYNQLRAKLISIDEVEGVWSDLILATQFLFRSIAPRFRERAPYLSPQH
jgi:phage terminase Nu1 subunit (DNA packaging protein)